MALITNTASTPANIDFSSTQFEGVSELKQTDTQ